MRITRRNFVKTSVAIPFLPSLCYGRILGANERLNLAFIGTGGMGTAHARNVAGRLKGENINITHVCDVYKRRLNNAIKVTGGKPTMEYREILDANDVDAVVIMTEWNEFRAMDLKKLKSIMKSPVILDTRNILNIAELKELGFKFDNVGRK